VYGFFTYLILSNVCYLYNFIINSEWEQVTGPNPPKQKRLFYKYEYSVTSAAVVNVARI
jgi:hypothetical protein